MPQTRDNGAVVPINADAYNLAPDLATFADSLGVITNVSTQAQRDALTKYVGRTVRRLDITGLPLEVWDGGQWLTRIFTLLGEQTNGAQTVTGTAQNALVTKTVTLLPSRRTKITAKVIAKPDTAGLFAEYQIYAGGTGLDAFDKAFSVVNVGESLEFTAAWGSGSGGSVQFSLQCRVVYPSGTAGLVKSDAGAVKLTITDDGIG